MKLLIEEIQDFEVLTEGTGESKNHFIKGIFMQSEKKNRNGRIYPKSVMESSVNKYIEEFVSKNRAVGELSHPETPSLNPDRVSHIITELKFEGSDVHGKAKLLETPCGKIVKALLDGGVNVGVSSRSLGSLKEENGVKIVQPDLVIACVDVVLNPSAHDAWVSSVMESAEWLYDPAKGWTQQHIEEAQKTIRKTSSKDIERVALQIFENYINKL